MTKTEIIKKILKYLMIAVSPIILLLAIGVALMFYPVPDTVSNTNTEDPAIKKIQANGLEFAYLEAGEGPLVLLFHGFPDNAHTWDEVLPRLAENGYHAVAVYDRGYFPTEIPADNDYSVETMGKDALALIDALGYEKAVIIGQDFGASIAYAAANINPEKVSKLITIGIPHPRVIEPSPELFRKLPHFLTLQFGPLSEWYARRNNFAYLQYLTQYWSPSWKIPESQITQIREDFSRPGQLTAALRYYHFGITDGFDSAKTELYKKITSVPTLTFAGEDDLMLELFKNMKDAFSGSFELVTVPKAGHFAHREQPEIFAEKLLEFLKRS